MAPLVWHYQVVRLWQMSAEALLALDQPALLALVGQLRFAPPAAIVQQVTQHIETLTDETALERLFTAAVRSANLVEFQTAMTQG